MTQRIEKTVKIVNVLGLHARPSAKLVTLASKFSADIWVKKDQREVSAKSIMGVMMLAAAVDAELTLIAQGADAEAAIAALSELIADRFAEES